MLVESTILLERIKHTSMKLDNSIQDIDKHFRSTHTRTHNVVWLFGSLFCALICMRTIECLSVSSIAIGCFIAVVSTFPHTMLYLSLEANKENVRQSASHIWLRNKHTVRMLLLWIVVDCSTCHACPQSSKANVQQISTSLLLLYYGLWFGVTSPIIPFAVQTFIDQHACCVYKLYNLRPNHQNPR